MGSGKGKSRRVQAAPALVIPGTHENPLRGAWCDKSKWAGFVTRGGLENVRVFPYYLAEDAAKDDEAIDRTKVIQELFVDAVSVGSLILPEPCVVDDFHLEMRPGRPVYDRTFIVTLKRNPGLRCIPNSYFLELGNTMGHNNVHHTLNQIAMAINRLLEGEGREQANAKP